MPIPPSTALNGDGAHAAAARYAQLLFPCAAECLQFFGVLPQGIPESFELTCLPVWQNWLRQICVILATPRRSSGGRSAGVRPVALCLGMLVESLRVVLSGYQREPSPPLVRHDEIRESGEGAAVLCAEEEEQLPGFSSRRPGCLALRSMLHEPRG